MKLQGQISESLRLNAILSFSGGLQDAYSYNVRGQVFANAQTGNVVLMSQHFLKGEVLDALRYLLPVFFFMLGILVTEKLGFRYKYARRLHWRQAVLLVEVALLALVGFLPPEWNMLANMLVSFTCAMQVQAFRKVRGYAYSSTMCIGNLRSGTESLSQFLRDRKREELYRALHYFGMILVFALGAGAGGVLSGVLGIRTIWVSALLLLLDCGFMGQKPEGQSVQQKGEGT